MLYRVPLGSVSAAITGTVTSQDHIVTLLATIAMLLTCASSETAHWTAEALPVQMYKHIMYTFDVHTITVYAMYAVFTRIIPSCMHASKVASRRGKMLRLFRSELDFHDSYLNCPISQASSQLGQFYLAAYAAALYICERDNQPKSRPLGSLACVLQ